MINIGKVVFSEEVEIKLASSIDYSFFVFNCLKKHMEGLHLISTYAKNLNGNITMIKINTLPDFSQTDISGIEGNENVINNLIKEKV